MNIKYYFNKGEFIKKVFLLTVLSLFIISAQAVANTKEKIWHTSEKIKIAHILDMALSQLPQGTVTEGAVVPLSRNFRPQALLLAGYKDLTLHLCFWKLIPFCVFIFFFFVLYLKNKHFFKDGLYKIGILIALINIPLQFIYNSYAIFLGTHSEKITNIEFMWNVVISTILSILGHICLLYFALTRKSLRERSSRDYVVFGATFILLTRIFHEIQTGASFIFNYLAKMIPIETATKLTTPESHLAVKYIAICITSIGNTVWYLVIYGLASYWIASFIKNRQWKKIVYAVILFFICILLTKISFWLFSFSRASQLALN